MTESSDAEIFRRFASRSLRRGQAFRRRRLVSSIAVAVIVLVIIVLFWVVIHRQPHEVSGTVRCLSGSPVQGIYVKEGRGTGTFPAVERDPANPSVARFVTDVRGSRLYGVNIGCGPLGTKNWTHTPSSGYVPRGYHEFECHDQTRDPLYRRCVKVK